MKVDIAVLVHTWFPNHQILFDRVQQELSDLRMHYLVFSARDANRAWHIGAGATVVPTVVPGIHLAAFSREVNVNLGVSKRLAGINPRLVITKGWGDPGYFAAHRFAKRRDIPIITWMCGRDRNLRCTSAFRQFSSRLARRALRSSRLVFVYGTRAKCDAVDLGARPENVIVVKHMIDDVHFDYRHSNLSEEGRRTMRGELGLDDSPLFLCISQLVGRKGIPDLLRAFDILMSRGIAAQLLLIGKGPMQTVVEKYAAGHPGAFRWIESVPYRQIPTYYHISDCLVFPTHFDAWGTVVNESQWAKTPVICSDGSDACVDLVRHERTGLIYPAGDVDDLVNLMQYAVEHDSHLTRMAEHAYDSIKSTWSLDDSVRLWSQYITQAIE